MRETQIALALDLLRSLLAQPSHLRSVPECIRLLALPYHHAGTSMPAARATLLKWARFGVVVPSYPELRRPFLELCADVDAGRLTEADLCLARPVAQDHSMAALQRAVDMAQTMMSADDYLRRTSARDHTALLSSLTRAAAQLTPRPPKGQHMTDEELLEKCVALLAAEQIGRAHV